MPGALLLERPADLARSGLVTDVDVVVADLSAQEVARRVWSAGDGRILECGQGRGTKSILLQGFSLDAGAATEIVGVDSEAFKVKVANARMRRAGLDGHVRCLEGDARSPGRVVDGEFDTVFVDAPCSGTGTLRRHPEIAWTRTADDVSALSELQLELVVAASRKVEPGGTLAYATCSVLEEENEGLVARFQATPEGRVFEHAGEGLRTSPAPDGPDGHFLALLRRR